MIERLELIDDLTPHDAAFNMALDEALLEEVGETAILRVYGWARPAVSLGCFERFAPVKEAYPDREWVRRWTGGGVVEHGDDLTYSLIAARESPLGAMRPMEAYREIHRAIGGAGAELAGADGPKVSQACFENPVRHDLLAAGRKAAGAAQRRTRRGFLHQGSVRVDLLPLTAESLAAALSGSVVRRPARERETTRARELAAERYAAREWLEKW